MKKILTLICAILLIFTLCVLPFMASAEDAVTDAGEAITAEPAPGELPSEFTWKYLVTTGGAAILVFFIVQYAKAPLDNVGHIPTRLLVYILVLVTLLVANTFLNHGITIEIAALCVFNALISAYSAYGMYEVWAKKRE